MRFESVAARGILCLLASAAVVCAAPRKTPRIEEALDVERVWSGHRVGFCLLTEGQRQYPG